ncbi:DNA-directed DNA polymerase II small subunit [Candidatus Woesearchaeota archaeon]|nr:DNA-directed DNA polymerase II small subunit [Candidatus Woesearchaeota archaeon]
MTTSREKLIEEMFEKGILLNEEMLKKGLDQNLIEKLKSESDLIVLNDDYADVIEQESSLVDWYEIDKMRVNAEKDRDDDLYQSQLQSFKTSTLSYETPEMSQKQEVSSLEVELEDTQETNLGTVKDYEEKERLELELELPIQKIDQPSSAVTIVISYENKPHKFTVADFANFFTSRFKFLENILRNRQELQNMLSISRVLEKKERENVSIIGIVDEIGETKNGNLMLTLEDFTGKIKVLISKNKKDLFLDGKDLVFDEVVGISGVTGDKIIFAENIVWPDIPSTHIIKKGPEEEYVIFLSDIHVGSKLFLEDSFKKFIQWTNGKVGNDAQKAIANKVKYIFIAGDLVDGVGIYPGHESELSITTIEGQYKKFVELIKEIPSHIPIIICPGNHDLVHLAEPQPVFYQEFVPGLFELPNVQLVTNPALVNIGKKGDFDGFDVQMYHGYSFDYYVANVESIRNGGGYKRADLIMKFLLKRRHMAPSFTSTPYYPGHKEDPLLIKKVPDFFITGHIHYSSVANYKGITMISGSCWQGMTTFQEKLGHSPEPGRVPVVNLKTREVKVLRF